MTSVLAATAEMRTVSCGDLRGRVERGSQTTAKAQRTLGRVRVATSLPRLASRSVASWHIPSNGKPGLVKCPAHGERVAVDAQGKLLGRCSGCMRDAAEAARTLAWMRP